jgi:hypothetical protein
MQSGDLRMGAAPPHQVHRSPSARLPTEARGWRSMVRRSRARGVSGNRGSRHRPRGMAGHDRARIVGDSFGEKVGDQIAYRGVVGFGRNDKAEVLAALSPPAPGAVDSRYWGERFTALTFEWFGVKREWQEARRLAWGNLQNEWWSQHGRRWPHWQCAGCEQPICTRRHAAAVFGNCAGWTVRRSYVGRAPTARRKFRPDPAIGQRQKAQHDLIR